MKKVLLGSLFSVLLLLCSTSDAEAKVMWGKMELKQGQIGKVTILSDVRANKIIDHNSIKLDKLLKKGGVYRVYANQTIGSKLYYELGEGIFVQKSSKVKYETPSVSKLTQLKPVKTIVSNSDIAKKTSQVVTVIANGSKAKISLYEKNQNSWNEVLKTDGFVGKLGVGKVKEGALKTPKGSYRLGFAFGRNNPGTKLPFRKITPRSYWISNVKDPKYNTWQERKSSSKKDEHLIDYRVAYEYAIVINYHNGVGGGSAFFLHVSTGRPTAGCVSMPKSNMIKFIKRIKPGAYIINVNDKNEIANY